MTTQYPVEGADVAQLRAAHASGRRRTLLDVRPDMPEALARVVETAIRAEPEKRFTTNGQMIARVRSDRPELGNGARPHTERPRVPRAWIDAAIAVAATAILLIVVFRGRAVPPRAVERAPVAGEQEDYRRAHDLLAHYYRPQALETAIPLLEQIVAQDAQFAPAFADLGRANFLQFAQQRENEVHRTGARGLVARARAGAGHGISACDARIPVRVHRRERPCEPRARKRASARQVQAAAYGALAELQIRQGRTELVEATLHKAVSLAPDDWMLNMQLGTYYLDNGKWTRRVSSFAMRSTGARQSSCIQQPRAGVPRTRPAR